VADLQLDAIMEAAILRPGCKFVVRIDPDRATSELVHEFRSQLATRLPGVDVVVVAADGMTVYEPGEAVDG